MKIPTTTDIPQRYTWCLAGICYSSLAILPSFLSYAESYFNPAFLLENGTSVADLSRFERGNHQPAGVYRVDLWRNDEFIGSQDIHGGGSDLMFPHHENEIAQSTCAHDGQYVNYWMHSGMVMVDREKMSKSLGNFFTVRDVLKYYDAETVRYFLMSGHYRSQLNYSEENLKQARAALERLYTALRGTDKTVAPAGGEAFEARFIEAMDDDFNTPEAYSVLFDMAREVNRLKAEDMAAANAMASHLRKLSAVLGLLEQEPEAFLQSGAQADDSEVAEIEALIQQRLDARKAKDWAAADAARDRLNEMGIVLEDGPQGTTWRRK